MSADQVLKNQLSADLHHHTTTTPIPTAIKDNLPIVRTPSKTLERPLGLVFLVYRGK